jgi:hypothetical protein
MRDVCPPVSGIDFGEQNTRNSLKFADHVRQRGFGPASVDLQRRVRQ